MSKKSKFWLITVLIMLCILLVVILKITSEPDKPEPPLDIKPQAESLSLNYEDVTICVGEKLEFIPSVEQGSVYESISYESSNQFVAKNDENILTALSEGETKFYAQLNNAVRAVCNVKVKKAPQILELSRSEVVLFEGESIVLSLATDQTSFSSIELKSNESIQAQLSAFEKSEDGLLYADVNIKGATLGETIFTAKTYNGLIAQCSIKVVEKVDIAQLEDFGVIYQFPELPTGCEVVSLTMAMRYLGFELSLFELADTYLPYTYNFRGDVNKYFLGHPRDPKSAGCYAPCIVTTAESYFEANELSDKWSVLNLTGSAPDVLYDYIAKGTPVVVWVTSSLQEPYVNFYCTGEDGEPIPWMFPEHCVALVGYDKTNELVWLADSEWGSVRSVPMYLFEHIYDMMMQQAVVVYKN